MVLPLRGPESLAGAPLREAPQEDRPSLERRDGAHLTI